MNKGQRAGDSALAIEVEQGKSYYWCSCGKSSKQPFCDGSHKGTKFKPLVYKFQLPLLKINHRIDYLNYYSQLTLLKEMGFHLKV